MQGSILSPLGATREAYQGGQRRTPGFADELIAKAMSPEADKRHADAAEFYAMLKAL